MHKKHYEPDQLSQERKAAGIAFRDIGNLLSADYYPQDLVTREKVKQMNLESLAEAKKRD